MLRFYSWLREVCLEEKITSFRAPPQQHVIFCGPDHVCLPGVRYLPVLARPGLAALSWATALFCLFVLTLETCLRQKDKKWQGMNHGKGEEKEAGKTHVLTWYLFCITQGDQRILAHTYVYASSKRGKYINTASKTTASCKQSVYSGFMNSTGSQLSTPVRLCVFYQKKKTNMKGHTDNRKNPVTQKLMGSVSIYQMFHNSARCLEITRSQREQEVAAAGAAIITGSVLHTLKVRTAGVVFIL